MELGDVFMSHFVSHYNLHSFKNFGMQLGQIHQLELVDM